MTTSYKKSEEIVVIVQKVYSLWTTDFHWPFYQFSEWVHHWLQMVCHSFHHHECHVCSPIKQTNQPIPNTFTYYCWVICSTQLTMDACCWQLFFFFAITNLSTCFVFYLVAFILKAGKRNCYTTFPLAHWGMYWATEYVPVEVGP